MINGRTRLHVVANGTMTGQRYIDEVLLPRVRLFRGAVGDKFVFMHDNATCHRTLAVQDCLEARYSTSRIASVLRSKPPLKMCGMLWEASCWSGNYSPTNKKSSSVHSQRNGMNCLKKLLDNVVQSMVRRGMLHHTPRWTYPV
ncbi:hypothetical protein TNCV_2582211 [Trichonephila clavipes]|nr:hypothetical protein TNCV_2582211 [Trichonephila clavipes]